MCLTIPKQVVLVKGGVATVRSARAKQEVGSIIKVKKGDWVLTQNNIIIRKISQKQAKEINKLLALRTTKNIRKYERIKFRTFVKLS